MRTRTLGSFTLTEAVGRGGMGVVWRARHTSGAAAAVKVLIADRARTDRWRRAFEREIRTQAGLYHPGIVEVYDTGLVPTRMGSDLPADSPWLAMAWVDFTLDRWLRIDRKHRRFAEIRRILLALLSALAHAHAHGVVHRDLKPDNVLVDLTTGAVRLTDFGIAATGDDDELLIRAGTPPFMAPEQILGEGPMGPSTDLYALGCLTHWLVTGSPPFEGSIRELRRAHRDRPPPPLPLPPRWPAALQGWVDTLLAKDPDRRFGRAADAAEVLRSLAPPHGEADRRDLPTPLPQRRPWPARGSAPIPTRAHRRSRRGGPPHPDRGSWRGPA